MPNQFGRILVVTVMTILVALFAAIYARHRSRKARLWLLGWLAIEVHFGSGVLAAFHLIPSHFALWLAYSTLFVTAGCLFLSVVAGYRTKYLRIAFWMATVAPAILYWTLMVEGSKNIWFYRGALAVLTAGCCALALSGARRSSRSVRVLAAVGGLAGVGFIAWLRAPGYGILVILASAYYACAIAYWTHYRRPSPGVLLTCFSLLAWGSVWPVAFLCGKLGVQIPGDSVLWDLPKYFVAFGMIVTLLEDQSAALTSEIAERQQAELALRETAHWLRVSQEVSQIGSLTFDFSTGQWSSSEALDAILGLPPDFARTGAAWSGLVDPEHRDDLEAYFRSEVFAEGHAFDREFLIVRRSDGHPRWVHGRGALWRDPAGRPLRIAGTVQDINDRKSVEEQLREAHKIESLGRLAGGVAHDFNNLLTVINGYCDLLLEKPGTLAGSAKSYISEIRTAGGRAADLTNQLLSFSRRQILQPRLLDLNTIVRSTESMLQRLMGEHIQIETRLEESLGMIHADPAQLKQALVHLAANARDAMPRGGTLTLATENVQWDDDAENSASRPRPGRYVCLVVGDSGCGMDEQTARHLFEPFFTTKKVGKGTGLGLATVHGIIHQNGGWIEVRSQVDQGTTFRIYFPSVQPDPARHDATASSEATGPASGGQETVLLVEDQDNVREMTAHVLRGFGYRVLEANGGEQALALSADFRGAIHLVLSDVVMPHMPGHTVVENLKRQRPELRALFMSGYTDDVIMHHGVIEGEVELLPKPFTPEQLARRTRKVLGSTA